jgi:hypothetical protein
MTTSASYQALTALALEYDRIAGSLDGEADDIPPACS